MTDLVYSSGKTIQIWQGCSKFSLRISSKQSSPFIWIVLLLLLTTSTSSKGGNIQPLQLIFCIQLINLGQSYCKVSPSSNVNSIGQLLLNKLKTRIDVIYKIGDKQLNLRMGDNNNYTIMRKKQANPYKSIKNLAPPYLTKEQINQFQSQFTLLDKELSVKRLREVMIAQNYNKTDKIVIQFIEELKTKEKIGFEEYVQAMIEFFMKQDMNDAIVEILADPQSGEISRDTIKEILQDSLGRDIYLPELNTIIDQLKKQESSVLKLKRQKTQQDSPEN